MYVNIASLSIAIALSSQRLVYCCACRMWKTLLLFCCIGPVECPAASCVWRSFWGSEVPPAHVWGQQVWLWQPGSDLPAQGSQRRAPEDPEIPHWRTWVWSKPDRSGTAILACLVHFANGNRNDPHWCQVYFLESSTTHWIHEQLIGSHDSKVRRQGREIYHQPASNPGPTL